MSENPKRAGRPYVSALLAGWAPKRRLASKSILVLTLVVTATWLTFVISDLLRRVPESANYATAAIVGFIVLLVLTGIADPDDDVDKGGRKVVRLLKVWSSDNSRRQILVVALCIAASASGYFFAFAAVHSFTMKCSGASLRVQGEPISCSNEHKIHVWSPLLSRSEIAGTMRCVWDATGSVDGYVQLGLDDEGSCWCPNSKAAGVKGCASEDAPDITVKATPCVKPLPEVVGVPPFQIPLVPGETKHVRVTCGSLKSNDTALLKISGSVVVEPQGEATANRIVAFDIGGSCGSAKSCSKRLEWGGNGMERNAFTLQVKVPVHEGGEVIIPISTQTCQWSSPATCRLSRETTFELSDASR